MRDAEDLEDFEKMYAMVNREGDSDLTYFVTSAVTIWLQKMAQKKAIETDSIETAKKKLEIILKKLDEQTEFDQLSDFLVLLIKAHQLYQYLAHKTKSSIQLYELMSPYRPNRWLDLLFCDTYLERHRGLSSWTVASSWRD